MALSPEQFSQFLASQQSLTEVFRESNEENRRFRQEAEESRKRLEAEVQALRAERAAADATLQQQLDAQRAASEEKIADMHAMSHVRFGWAQIKKILPKFKALCHMWVEG